MNLETHHKNYQNLWRELPERDCETLCSHCHQVKEGRVEESTEIELVI